MTNLTLKTISNTAMHAEHLIARFGKGCFSVLCGDGTRYDLMLNDNEREVADIIRRIS